MTLDDRTRLDRWAHGPPGFVGKANKQLAQIERRLPAVAPGQQVPNPGRLEWPSPTLAKITGAGSAAGLYTADLYNAVWDGSSPGAWTVSPGGEQFGSPGNLPELRELNGAPVAVGSFVWVQYGADENGDVLGTFAVPSPRTFAKITAVAAMSGSDSRFVYTVTQVTLSVTASGGTPTAVSSTAVTGGFSGAKALNLAEWLNASSTGIAFGVDRAGADYPAGFAPRPVSGGGTGNTHQQDVIVEITGSVIASDGSTIYLFDRQGAHDGTCDA